MTDSSVRSGAHRLGFMIPLVLFVLFFVACCGVLASVFIQATEVSSRAGQYSDAVQLCRNEAERLRSAGTSEIAQPPIDGTQVLYYDGSYQPAQAETAAYTMTLTEQRTPAGAGTIRTFTVTVCAGADTESYSLDVAVYLPEGR